MRYELCSKCNSYQRCIRQTTINEEIEWQRGMGCVIKITKTENKEARDE